MVEVGQALSYSGDDEDDGGGAGAGGSGGDVGGDGEI